MSAGLDYALIQVRGRDAARFLQAQTTSNISRLGELQSQVSALTDRKAHLVAYFRLYCLEADRFIILAQKNMIQPICEHLDRFLFADQVTIEPLTGKLIYLSGDCIYSDLANVSVPVGMLTDKDDISALVWGQDSQNLALIMPGPIPAIFVYAALPDDPDLGQLLDNTSAIGVLDQSSRIQQGILVWGRDIDSRDLIVDLGLDDPAISYDKGCYQGQEVIARIKANGAPASRIVGIEIIDFDKEKWTTDPSNPDQIDRLPVAIYDQNTKLQIGRISSLDRSSGRCFAHIKRDWLTISAPISFAMYDTIYEAWIRLLPQPFAPILSHRDHIGQMIERAQRAFTDGKVDIAESTLRSVLATHPDQTEALESLGVVLAKTDRVKPAIELMQRLLEIDPQSVMACANLSVFYLQIGDKEKAEAALADSMAIRMRLAAREADMAKAKKEAENSALEQAKEQEQAMIRESRERMSMFEQVLAIDEDDLFANHGMGSAHNNLGQWQSALPYLEKALRIKPSHTVAYLEYGKSLEGVGRIEDAIANYRKGIEIATTRSDMTPLKAMQERLAALQASAAR